MTALPQVLVVGETLVDIVHSPDGMVSEHVGGSPANVAMGIARLGHDTVLATSLGDDAHGTRCRGHVTDRGVAIENLDAGSHPTSTAVATSFSGTGRIDTTSGPDSLPVGSQGMDVTYMGTFVPASRCRTGTPAASSARSNVKLHPMRNGTRSARHSSTTSSRSATALPSR